VEKWLLELESIQWESIRHLIAQSIDDYLHTPRKDWILKWPAQVILAVSSLYWTNEVTASLRSGMMTIH
jgi:dynein heavy chain